MKRFSAILTIFFIVLLILSVPASAQDYYDDCNRPLIVGKENLYSGISAGTVVVTLNDQYMLVVDFETTDGWVMTETHLYVGESAPEKSAPDQFPYKHDSVEARDHDYYIVPLPENYTGGIIFFAAHAVLQRSGPYGEVIEETAWALGEPIRNAQNKSKNWAMYFACTTEANFNGDER